MASVWPSLLYGLARTRKILQGELTQNKSFVYPFPIPKGHLDITGEHKMRFGAIVIAVLTISLSAFAADPFVGTWKPNVEKWRLSADAPERRKSEVITFESVGKGQYRQTITTLDGKATNATYTQPDVWHVDGREYKFDGGITRKAERIGLRHFRMTASSGKGKGVFDYVVSADGKTLNVTR